MTWKPHLIRSTKRSSSSLITDFFITKTSNDKMNKSPTKNTSTLNQRCCHARSWVKHTLPKKQSLTVTSTTTIKVRQISRVTTRLEEWLMNAGYWDLTSDATNNIKKMDPAIWKQQYASQHLEVKNFWPRCSRLTVAEILWALTKSCWGSVSAIKLLIPTCCNMQRLNRSVPPAVEKLTSILAFLPKCNTKENMAAISFIYPTYL